MSRLKRKILNEIAYLNRKDKLSIAKSSSRLLRKKVLASWKPVNIKGPELLQILTNAMTYNSTIRINYRNSGWRSILPYGWNTSKDGNTLLMCYKDSGEIRSYRLDRIFDILINDDLDISHDESLSWKDFQMPTLPNIDEVINKTEQEINDESLPYDAALKALTTNVPEEESAEEYHDGEGLSDTINDLDTNNESNSNEFEDDESSNNEETIQDDTSDLEEDEFEDTETNNEFESDDTDSTEDENSDDISSEDNKE